MTEATELAWQPSLFGAADPRPDETFDAARRVELAPDAWVDHVPGWVGGADQLFADVVATTAWREHEVTMYDRRLVQPRLTARLDPPPPLVAEMAGLLSERYQVDFVDVGANFYRHGQDSVAWHGDRIARDLPSATVAILSLGDRRKFLLRPKGGGRSLAFVLAGGDLLVMGGSCQRTWDHSVPKVAAAGPRVSITFRHRYGGRSTYDG